MRFLGPPQAENFWGQNPLSTIPPLVTRQFLTRGGIVDKDYIDRIFWRKFFLTLCFENSVSKKRGIFWVEETRRKIFPAKKLYDNEMLA